MTNFVVKATWSGTSKTIAIPARNAAIALDKARTHRECKGASCFVVYYRKLGNIPVVTGLCSGFDSR
jgi:hypothetical protein